MVAALSLIASVAHADRVHLVGGAVIEGKATREGDQIVIELESGKLGLPADQVARIEASVSPVQQFEQRHARLAARDVAGRLALADYCRDHGMSAREQQLLREVIELAPDHEDARARLGFVRSGKGWVEREQDLRARGLVQHEGRWLTPEQLLEIERLRAQAAIAAHQRDKAQAEAEAARAELETRKRDVTAETAAEAAKAAPPPSVEVQAAPIVWWPAFDHHGRHHHHERDCWRKDCRPTWGRPRTDGRPAWPIVGTKDPFDYLR